MTLTSVQQSAYNDIQSRLSDNWYSGVNEGDLNAVRETLQNLGATDADAVIDAMEGSGLLKKLAEESNEGEFLGAGQDGFEPHERQALFTDLAGKLDGQSLAAVSNAFAGAETGETDFNVVTELGAAVAERASPQAKLDYINALKGSTDGSGISNTVSSGYSAATLTRHVDSEAGAIGTVLASLEGPYAAAAFRSLDDQQLAAVLQTGVDEFSSNAGTGGGSTFDSALIEGVLRAAGTMTGPDTLDIRARVFDAAATRLNAVEDAGAGLGFYAENEAAVTGITQGMTALLNTDTSGMMRQLAYHMSTEDGGGMTAYVESMIASGQTEALGDILTDLQFGNQHNENALQRLDQVFTDANGQRTRENAGALGYFIGSVYAGAADHGSDIATQREEIKGILEFALGKIPLAGGFSAGDATLGQDVIGNALEQAIADNGAELGQRLENGALPHHENGRRAVGDEIYSAFSDRVDQVRRTQGE